MSAFPAGAECWEIIRTTGIIVEEELYAYLYQYHKKLVVYLFYRFTIAANGATLSGGASTPSASSDLDSSTALRSSIGTGSIVGAVIGSIFGSLLIGAVSYSMLTDYML